MAGGAVRLAVAGEGIAEVLLTAYRHLLLGEDEPAARGWLRSKSMFGTTACGQPGPVRYLRDCFPRSRPFGRAVLAQSGDNRVRYQLHGRAPSST